jgi:hypothetical protein
MAAAPRIVDATVVARDPSVPTVPLDDGILMMSIGQGRYFSLDEIGREIWQRIEEPCRLDDLLDRLGENYDAPREVIANDVRAWIGRLAAAELIRLS